MTDDIGTYSFNFQKEADDLRRSLASRSDNIFFVETDVTYPEDGASPKVDLQHIISNQQFKDKYSSDVPDWIKSTYSNRLRAYSLARSYIDEADDTSIHVVSILKKESATETFGEGINPLMRLFVLYHETGHALMPDGPAIDDNHPFQECAADAYAALSFFQRFGREAGDFLSMISWHRSFLALTGKTDHLTTTVLDKIIADSAYRDFSKLNPVETIELAETYAKQWTPEASVISAARPRFAQKNGIDIGLLAQTCLASSSDNFSFYIGAKLFQPFLQPEGINFNGQTLRFSDTQRQGLVASIEKRSDGLGLHNIFNRAAVRPADEPSLTELLKVSRPKGQKQFTVKI